MALMKDFRSFTLKGNVVDLAVAVVLGTAFAGIVKAIVDGVIMPLVGALLPKGSWQTYTVTPLHFQVGQLVSAIVNFTIIAFTLFVVVVKFMGALKKAAPVRTKKCSECLEEIPLEARRCRACGSLVSGGVA
jgi:large conductance mechanosensitive channel